MSNADVFGIGLYKLQKCGLKAPSLGEGVTARSAVGGGPAAWLPKGSKCRINRPKGDTFKQSDKKGVTKEHEGILFLEEI